RGQRRGTARSPARLGRLTGRRLRWSSAVDTDESIAVRTRATTDSPPGPGRGQDTRAPGLGGMGRRDSERDPHGPGRDQGKRAFLWALSPLEAREAPGDSVRTLDVQIS